jgi:hypothetical protein
MARRRRQLGDIETPAGRWLSSATKNFQRIRSRRNTDGCDAIEHYTDVIAEATAASATAPSGSATATRAERLASEATHAQRQAVQVCRRSALSKSRR